ncbi:MAG: 50S ribosomal protein L23 [Candidatus Pacearchaeota archaeon]
MILQGVKTTEKIIKMIEAENTLCFITDRKTRKKEIEKEVEELFNVKIEKVRTMISGNKKYAYVKLKKEYSAADVATKIGVL